MSNLVQNATGEQNSINNSSFVSTANGNAFASTTATVFYDELQAVGANSVSAIFAFDLYYGAPHTFKRPQLYVNQNGWLYQFMTYPFLQTQQGKTNMSGVVPAIERKAPGGGADPAGRIPQHELPTKLASGSGTGADDSNPASGVLFFPPHTIVP